MPLFEKGTNQLIPALFGTHNSASGRCHCYFLFQLLVSFHCAVSSLYGAKR